MKLTTEQIILIERDVLNKPKKDWSSEELNLFHEWFETKYYIRGVRSLSQSSTISFGGTVVFRSALSIEDAMDVVQEWWYKFDANVVFDPTLSPFESYYFNGLKRFAITKIRKTRREVLSGDVTSNYDDQEDEMSLADYLVSIGKLDNDLSINDKIFEIKQQVTFLIQKLKNKPPMPDYVKYADAVEYRFLYNLEYAEIAAKLGVEESYARVLKLRGLKYLKEIAIEEGLLQFNIKFSEGGRQL